MPKVSSIRFNIKGESRELAIHYLKDQKFYIKDFPDEVNRIVWQATSDFTRAGNKFETEQELIDYYEAFLERYHKIISETKKVIAYHIAAPNKFKELKEVTKEVKDKLGYGGSGENQFGFTIDYGVFLMRTGDGTGFFDINEDGTAGRNANFPFNHCTIIDYTPEREAFLEGMKERMRGMFLKVISFMMDEKKFIQVMDSNTKLLN